MSNITLSNAEVRALVSKLQNEGNVGLSTHYCDALPEIKKLMVNRADRLYSYNSFNQFLIKEIGLKKATASEMKKVAKRFYLPDGNIKPYYKDFQYSVLVKLCSFTDRELDMLIENNVLSHNITKKDIDDVREKMWSIYAQDKLVS